MIISLALSVTLWCVCSVEALNEQIINYYLLDHCNQPDLNSNLAKAKEFLIESVNKASTDLNEGLRKDWQVFLSLEAIENNVELCNGKSIAILSANNRLVGNIYNKVNKSGLNCLTRLESLVYQALLKHANQCQSVYPKKYDMEVKKLNFSLINRAQEVTRDLAYGRKTSTVSWELLLYQGRWVHQALVRAAQLANDNRIGFASAYFDDSIGKSSIDMDKLHSLYQDYILIPCNYYVDKLGPDLFEPVIFDLKLKQSELITELETYQECKLIINEEYSKKLFENLIKFVLLPKPKTFQ